LRFADREERISGLRKWPVALETGWISNALKSLKATSSDFQAVDFFVVEQPERQSMKNIAMSPARNIMCHPR
jgi:hypothetical protein